MTVTAFSGKNLHRGQDSEAGNQADGEPRTPDI